MTQKRRFIEQLPAALRTEDLKKFFSATVDHVFQPGKAEAISGYIGQTPSYYDEQRDFYIAEPTPKRGLRQLDPVMVSASDSAIASVLFYDDLVNHVQAEGGITDDEQRLFDNEYYSWAPPVDLGKLTSPQNYFWFGDNPEAIPGLLLSAPVFVHVGDSLQQSFALPPGVSGVSTADEAPAVWINGIPAIIQSRNTNSVTLGSAPPPGAIIEVYRYGDLSRLIANKVQFNPAPFTQLVNYHVSDGQRTTYTAPVPVVGYASTDSDVSFYVNGVELSRTQWTISAGVITLLAPVANNTIVRITRYRNFAAGVTALSNGMRVVFNDEQRRIVGFDTSGNEVVEWDNVPVSSFLIDGVGVTIELLDHTSGSHPEPLYTVIDRRSRDRNPWSKSNFWVHRSAFEWAHVVFSSRVAKRPIVEFKANIELDNYGSDYVGRVDCVLSGTATRLSDDTPLASAAQINGLPSESVAVDDGTVLKIGHRLLIRNRVDGRDDLSSTIVNVVEAINGQNQVVMALQPESGIALGSIVSVSATTEVYHKTATSWVASQTISGDGAPVFAIFDLNGTPTAGSKIFGFATRETGTIDSLLGIALRYDALGQIVFENFLNTEATAMRFYRIGDELASDWHPIEAPSIFAINEAPSNLQANPDNEQVSFISKNEWLDHFKAIIENQVGFEGDAFGVNNWHNTARELDAAGDSPLKILQHRSPMLKLMLLAANKTFDFADAARFVDQEYTRFRSRFVNTVFIAYRDGSVRDTTPGADIVRQVLQSLKTNKTSDFPFALTLLGDTLGRETFFIPPSATAIGVYPATVPGVETDTSFGGSLGLLRGHDGSRVPLFSDTVEFVGTGSQTDFILDNEPAGPITVTVNGTATSNFSAAGLVVTMAVAPGNGASVVISVDDIRDRAMLALERAIYDTLPARFRTEASRGFELTTWQNARYRSNAFGYSRSEVSRVFAPMFLLWAQKNGFDYRANDSFEQTDPFTWNYSSVTDSVGSVLPGHWRGIYRWYFDTDRPHIAPWEMLGFAQMPTWWTAEYGAAPFTSGNTKLWQDLRDGKIAQGPRAGIDARFARPNLLSVLPVDPYGDLLDPIAANVVITAPNYYQASRNWAVGDGAHIEHLWRTSPSFPFAFAQAAYLLKPARFVEATWDTLQNDTINDQLVHLLTQNRARCADLITHGERDLTGARQPVCGIQQWIAERMISIGQDPAVLGVAVRGLGVRLGHKMAGFINADNLRVVADNFGLVPEEDVSVLLYTSPSIRQEFYSGVIIERSASGWRVFGYDAINPSFIIEEGDPAGDKDIISIADAPEVVINEWKANVYFKEDFLVDYKGSLYQCIQPHTSTGVFEQQYWEAKPDILRPQAARMLRFSDGSGIRSEIPYGTEFATYQEVGDFLFGYERYLLSRGWKFDITDDNGSFDWSRAARDFLEWAALQWEEGNFIALSPGAIGLTYETDHGSIYSLEQAFNGAYGVVNREGLPIQQRDSFVSRIDGEVTIKSVNDDLFGVRLNVGEVEHAIVFSNETIFTDIIYKPLFDLRQPRLRLSGHRTIDWTGRFDAPGYILTDSGIVSNFNQAPEDIRTAFDVEGAGNKNMRDHARHMVGFENRDYMRNLLLSDTQQFEFYQGMIQQKGSPGVFSKMLRSQFIEQDRNLRFLEEWAFKSSEYGAVDATTRYSFEFLQQHIARNPQLVRFFTNEVTDGDDGVHRVSISQVISGANALPAAFPLRADYKSQTGDLPSAGYARLNEVTYTTFDLNTLSSLYVLASAETGRAFANGERIWVYDGQDHRFDVLRSTDLRDGGGENRIMSIEVSQDGSYSGARIVLEYPHGLTDDDKGMLLVLDGETRAKADLVGVQRVFDFGDDWIELDIGATEGYRWIAQDDEAVDANDPENAPVVRALRSVRFADEAALLAASWFIPAPYEIAYLDHDPAYLAGTRWVVRSFFEGSWDAIYRVQPRKVDARSITGSLIYDTATKITPTRLISEPLVVDRLTVIDPIGGLIPGEAERELTYKLEYDPARYSGTAGLWGAERVGELWWDVSTVRFINPETDEPDGVTRVLAEQAYRVDNWGRIAPGTQVDVYEWTRSLVAPAQYSGAGSVYRSANPNAVETVEYDAGLNRDITVYYFWVKGNRQVADNVAGRRLDAATVARIIENSTTLDLPWIAPTFIDALLVGGVSQYLNAETTVLQVDVRKINTDAKVHTEWALLRPEDDRSQPSAPLWNKLIDSLAGADRFKRQVPDPRLNRHAAQGVSIRPRQSLFGGSDNNREIMRLARESMVGMLNRIFAREDVVRQRVAPITKLLNFIDRFPTRNETETTPPVLSWSAQDEFECALPSRSEYDFEVMTRAERNALLSNVDFERARQTGEKIRVLINGLDETTPFWSVWVYDPVREPATFPDDLFSLAEAYTYRVADRAARDAGTYTAGDVVYVVSDNAADGFWTLWRYDPTHFAADAAGFVLMRSQDYRIGDFVNRVDWYAEGYSAANPPVVSFPTRQARDVAFGENPVSTFVRIEDDGDDSVFSGWMWTVFADGVWTTVAREKRTIEISDTLFSRLENPEAVTQYATSLTTQVTLEWDVPAWDMASFDGDPLSRHNIDNILTREGAMDVRALLKLLISEVLTEAETNEFFFSMVHFAHATFDQINWAFKTSFLYIGGYNEVLTQTPIQSSDNTENLLSYIDEVKPYRVKTRDFARGLTPPIDIANARLTDFDKPVYYDVAAGHYRRLNPANTADQQILATGQWKDWNDAHTRTGYDLNDYSPDTWNPIRRVRTRLLFDRVDGWVLPDETVPFFTGNAGERVNDFYEPKFTGQVENDLKALLKLGFKGLITDGQDFSSGTTLPNDVLIDGNFVDGPGSYILNGAGFDNNEPSLRENRPEELVFLGNQDYVSLNIRSLGRPGAPAQSSKFFDVSSATGSSTLLTYSDLAQSNDGIAVFRDGIRAKETDYTIDQFKREIVVGLVHDDASRVKRISLHVFGMAGITRIVEQRFYTFGPGDQQVQKITPRTGAFVVETFLNGNPIANTVNLASGTVTVAQTLVIGDDVLINVREGSGSPELRVVTTDLPYRADGNWTLTDWNSNRQDAHALVVVEVDGIRLTPPETKYLRVASGFRWSLIDHLPASGSDFDLLEFDDTEFDVATTERLLWNIYIGNDEYLGDVPDVSGVYDSLEDVVAHSQDIPERFAYWNTYIVCVDEEIDTDAVVIVINEGHDYTISREGVLTLVNPPVDTGSSRVRVTLFTKPETVGIETWTYLGRADGSYPIYRPYGGEYLWLTLNGKKQVYDVDFTLATAADIENAGDEFDNSFSSTAGNWDLDVWDDASLEYDTLPTPEPVIRFRPGHVATDEVVVSVFSGVPMRLPSGKLISSVVPGKSLMSESDETGIYTMEGGWEYLLVGDGNTGSLKTALTVSSTTIVVSLPDYSNELFTGPWFAQPQQGVPGVMWIKGERIEYNTMVAIDGQVTLTGVTRGSRGTGISAHPAGTQVIAATKPFMPRNSAL